MAKLSDWLTRAVTDDPRALAWLNEPGAEERIARGYKELLGGYAVDPSGILTPVRMLADTERPGPVTVQGITFYSLCAHHCLPFFGTVELTYVPGDRLIGLGKLPRLVHAYARRFQLQEDLGQQIGTELMESGGAAGVRVVARAQHLCMCSRGPAEHNAVTITEFVAGSLAQPS